MPSCEFITCHWQCHWQWRCCWQNWRPTRGKQVQHPPARAKRHAPRVYGYQVYALAKKLGPARSPSSFSATKNTARCKRQNVDAARAKSQRVRKGWKNKCLQR